MARSITFRRSRTLPGQLWADSAANAVLSPAAGVAIDSLPARLLAQRPDVFNAEREEAAAS